MSVLVTVLAYDRLNPFHLAVPGVVFGEIGPEHGREPWNVVVCGPTPGRLTTSDGYALVVDHGLDVMADADLVIVPSWQDPDIEPPVEVLDALRGARARGATVVGLCLGAFVLAAAGLLDGRRATTHWRAAETLARRHPLVQVDRRVLYVDDGDIITAAGTAASIDACLHIVRDRLGSSVANQVARGLVAAPHRDGGQAQYIEQPVPVLPDGAPLTSTIQWALENLDQKLAVEVLAARAHMSVRTFERAFSKNYGCTPAAWVRRQRLRKAQQLLESTTLPVSRIAEQCGVGSAVTLRQSFTAEIGVSPLAYRRSFTRIGRDTPPRGEE